MLKEDNNSRSQEYLSQFADREGTTFLLRFWKRYRGKSTQDRLETFLDSVHPTPTRLAAVHRYLLPNADQATFNAFVRAHMTKTRSAPNSPTNAWKTCIALTALAPGTCQTRATLHGFTHWICGWWAICCRTLMRSSRTPWPPVISNARKSTAGCSRVNTRAPGTVASVPCWRSRLFSISISAGNNWAIRLITWYPRSLRPSAAPATAPPPWLS